MVEQFVNKLIELGYKVTTAESCTGGMVSSTIVGVANASRVFDEAYVTYANESKIKNLGVNPETIKQYGVVSEFVTKEMVIGLHKKNGSDVCLATSGIAGPGGGTATKPVGMVCFGIAIKDKVYTYTKFFGEIGRNNVREKSTNFIIEEALRLLDSEN